MVVLPSMSAANPGGNLQTWFQNCRSCCWYSCHLESLLHHVNHSIDGDCVSVHQFESVFKELVDVTSCKSSIALFPVHRKSVVPSSHSNLKLIQFLCVWSGGLFVGLGISAVVNAFCSSCYDSDEFVQFANAS